MRFAPLALVFLAVSLRAAPEYPFMGPDLYDVQADGAQQIAAALAEARSEHKRVLVDFGANWCIWCRRLDHTFVSDPAVAARLHAGYVLVLVDVNTRRGTDRNAEVVRTYQNPVRFGIPVLVVLEADGRMLTTKDSGELEEGDHHSPAKILAFLEAWAVPTP